ncbi:MAG: hypothetical protein U0800_17805 [Isosphaeraceae bacterium]
MPRQNRVTPFGEIVAVADRGAMMGNRGRIHEAGGRIARPWQVKRWILCRLEFNGRHRAVMAPDRYTELFFLDEATGLAAGHRPCFECRRQAYRDFAAAWAAGNAKRLPSAGAIDEQLHRERIGPGRSKRTFRHPIDDLPDGVFVSPEDGDGTACLLRQGRLFAWSPGGYTGSRPTPAGGVVSVLTPASTVAAIRAGYAPEMHASAVLSGREPGRL